MARYIDADKLMNEIDELKKSPWYNNDYDGHKCARQEAVSIVVDLCIKRAPTADVVEVIRCKDCALRKTEDCAMYYECDYCECQHTWESDNDYCNWAKRKEDEE